MRLAVSEVILNDRIIFTGIVHDLADHNQAKSEIISLNKDLEKKVSERTRNRGGGQQTFEDKREIWKVKSLKKYAEDQLVKTGKELKIALKKEKRIW